MKARTGRVILRKESPYTGGSVYPNRRSRATRATWRGMRPWVKMQMVMKKRKPRSSSRDSLQHRARRSKRWSSPTKLPRQNRYQSYSLWIRGMVMDTSRPSSTTRTAVPSPKRKSTSSVTPPGRSPRLSGTRIWNTKVNTKPIDSKER